MRNKNEINMEKSNYPQFISNLPCGDDYTEGKAQERLSKAIATHIYQKLLPHTLNHPMIRI